MWLFYFISYACCCRHQNLLNTLQLLLERLDLPLELSTEPFELLLLFKAKYCLIINILNRLPSRLTCSENSSAHGRVSTEFGHIQF